MRRAVRLRVRPNAPAGQGRWACAPTLDHAGRRRRSPLPIDGVSRRTVLACAACAAGASFRFHRTRAGNGYRVIDGVEMQAS
ncbi:hypothetical protein GCM10010381_12910 [Streptomyces xantholiticus]|nr:hypothetical protein GCM10010381_12910 [Streptomyces xantholiticus]